METDELPEFMLEQEEEEEEEAVEVELGRGNRQRKETNYDDQLSERAWLKAIGVSWIKFDDWEFVPKVDLTYFFRLRRKITRTMARTKRTNPSSRSAEGERSAGETKTRMLMNLSLLGQGTK